LRRAVRHHRPRPDRHARHRRRRRGPGRLPRSRHRGGPGMTDVRRARGAVTAIFFLNGLLFGAWAARIPAIRDRLALSDGELGLALALLPVGAIIAMPLAGALAARAGSRRAPRAAFAFACTTIG